jgi:hypothetical protein
LLTRLLNAVIAGLRWDFGSKVLSDHSYFGSNSMPLLLSNTQHD